MDGYLQISGSEKERREGDDGRSRLGGDEESGVSAGGSIVGRQ